MDAELRAEVTSALALIEELSTKSSDSGLSEDTCWELFGGPCPESLRKRRKSLEEFVAEDEEEEDTDDKVAAADKGTIEDELPTEKEKLSDMKDDNTIEDKAIDSIEEKPAKEYQSSKEDVKTNELPSSKESQIEKGTSQERKSSKTSGESIKQVSSLKPNQILNSKKSDIEENTTQASDKNVLNSNEENQSPKKGSKESQKTQASDKNVLKPTEEKQSSKKDIKSNELSSSKESLIEKNMTHGSKSSKKSDELIKQQSEILKSNEKHTSELKVIKEMSEQDLEMSNNKMKNGSLMNQISETLIAKQESKMSATDSQEAIKYTSSTRRLSSDKSTNKSLEHSDKGDKTIMKTELTQTNRSDEKRVDLSKENKIHSTNILEKSTNGQRLSADSNRLSATKSASPTKLSRNSTTSADKNQQTVVPNKIDSTNILEKSTNGQRLSADSNRLSATKSASPAKLSRNSTSADKNQQTVVPNKIDSTNILEKSTNGQRLSADSNRLSATKSASPAKLSRNSTSADKNQQTVVPNKIDSTNILEKSTNGQRLSADSNRLSAAKLTSPTKLSRNSTSADKNQQTVVPVISHTSTNTYQQIQNRSTSTEANKSYTVSPTSSTSDQSAKYTKKKQCNCRCCVERQIQHSYKKQYHCKCCCKEFEEGPKNNLKINIYQEDTSKGENEENDDKKIFKITSFTEDKPRAVIKCNKRLQTSMINIYEHNSNNSNNNYPLPYMPFNISHLYPNPLPMNEPQKINKPTKFKQGTRNSCKCYGDTKNASSSSESSETLDNTDKETSNFADSLKNALEKRNKVRETANKFEQKNKNYSETYQRGYANTACCRSRNAPQKSRYTEKKEVNEICGCCCRPKPNHRGYDQIPVEQKLKCNYWPKY